VIGEAYRSTASRSKAFAKPRQGVLRQPLPGCRLNFFVDEAGQFIGQDRKPPAQPVQDQWWNRTWRPATNAVLRIRDLQRT